MAYNQIIQDFLTINKYYSKYTVNTNINQKIELSNYFLDNITIDSFYNIKTYSKCDKIIINKDNAFSYLRSIMENGWISKYNILNNTLSIKIHYDHELIIYLDLIFIFNEDNKICNIFINKL